MYERQRLFAIAALAKGLITETEFLRRSGNDDVIDRDLLRQVLVDEGRLSPANAAEFDEVLEQRFRDSQQQTLERLLCRHVRQLLPSICQPAVASVLRRWTGMPTEPTVNVEPLVNSLERTEYRLLRVLDEGGMGQVWVATDPTLDRQLTIKRLRPLPGSSDERARRLLREAKLTAQLEHPNIVPVHELGEESDSGLPFFAMRYVLGKTLRAEIAAYHSRKSIGEDSPLNLPRLLGQFHSTCNAIAFAHSRGVIHRDLKPDNILVGSFGEVVVLDWGLAKRIDLKEGDDGATSGDSVVESALDATQAGRRLGTPSYMAPEQAAGDLTRIDKATDVYGLGAILFEILVGSAPHSMHRVQNVAEFYRTIIESASPVPANFVSDLDSSLDAVCRKAMAKEPGDRYASVAALSEDIERWLAGEPVSVHTELWFRRTARWMGRRPLATSGMLMSSIILLGGLLAFVGSRLSDFRELEIVENETLVRRHEEVESGLASEADTLRRQLTLIGQSAAAESILAASPDKIVGGADPKLKEAVEAVAQPMHWTPEILRCELIATDPRPVRRFLAKRPSRNAEPDLDFTATSIQFEPPESSLQPTIALRSDPDGDLILQGTIGVTRDRRTIAWWRMDVSLTPLFDREFRHVPHYRRYYITAADGAPKYLYAQGVRQPLKAADDRQADESAIVARQLAALPLETESTFLPVTPEIDVAYTHRLTIADVKDGRLGYVVISNYRDIFGQTKPMRDIAIAIAMFVGLVLTATALLAARFILRLKPRSR